MSDPLYLIKPDGQVVPVANTYESIKASLDGATMDFSMFSPTGGLYLDDEGLLKGLPLNVVASFCAGRPMYGPCVLCAAQPDREGNTLPPDKDDVNTAAVIGERWHQVIMHITVSGTGDPYTYGSMDDLMPPLILTGEEADVFLYGEDDPEDTR